jgi:hypothetical protein
MECHYCGTELNEGFNRCHSCAATKIESSQITLLGRLIFIVWFCGFPSITYELRIFIISRLSWMQTNLQVDTFDDFLLWSIIWSIIWNIGILFSLKHFRTNKVHWEKC